MISGDVPLVPGVRKAREQMDARSMSAIVINPKNGHEIIHTEEEYARVCVESCEWHRALENAVETPEEDQRDLVK